MLAVPEEVKAHPLELELKLMYPWYSSLPSTTLTRGLKN